MNKVNQVDANPPSRHAWLAQKSGRKLAAGALLALSAAGVGPTCFAVETAEVPAVLSTAKAVDAASGNEASQPVNLRRHAMSPMDRRVALLAKELELDASQRAKVREVLENQRGQVARVWGDESLAPAIRISATQAISDRTADQIRALLNEEQRKKYNLPRRHDVADSSAKPNVEDWMDAARNK